MKIAYQAFLGTNYGTVLQTFALYKKLEDIAGNDSVEIIGCSNFRKRPDPDTSLLTINEQKFLAQKMRKTFEFFIESNMKFSSVLDYIPADGMLKNEIKEELNKFDAFVCGSDQVWRPSKFWFCPKRYMTYAKNKLTVAYAPSVVINKEKEIPIEYKEDWIKYISDVSYISTREIGSSFLIEHLVNKPCQYVVDPTLLFSKQEWTSLLEINKSENLERYALIYMLDYYSYYKSFINNICKYYGLKQILILGRDMGDVPTLNKNSAETDPKQFITLLQNASLVIADGFHGCCLSIANNVDFLYMSNPLTNDIDRRIKDLFNRFSIKNRTATLTTEIKEIDCLNPINWDAVNKKVFKERKISALFLSKSLRGE